MPILPSIDILDTFLYVSFKHRIQIFFIQKLSSRGLSNTLISIVQITSWFNSVFTRLLNTYCIGWSYFIHAAYPEIPELSISPAKRRKCRDQQIKYELISM